jgi:hypothetical protein
MGLVACSIARTVHASRENMWLVLGIACTIEATFYIFTHSFLKEVCFSLEGNSIHPWRGVGDIVDSRQVLACFNS